MRSLIFPSEAWAITGGDEQPCLQLRDPNRSTLDICFDVSEREVSE